MLVTRSSAQRHLWTSARRSGSRSRPARRPEPTLQRALPARFGSSPPILATGLRTFAKAPAAQRCRRPRRPLVQRAHADSDARIAYFSMELRSPRTCRSTRRLGVLAGDTEGRCRARDPARRRRSALPAGTSARASTTTPAERGIRAGRPRGRRARARAGDVDIDLERVIHFGERVGARTSATFLCTCSRSSG